MKHLSAWEKNIRCSFGMDIETNTPAYRALKKNTVYVRTSQYAGRMECPARFVAAVMREAGWLVSENKCLEWFHIEDGPRIWIKY